MQGRISGWFAAITLALLAMALPARAELVADRDYVAIVPAQISDNPAKIEVLEFFSYGCPHCADFHPLVSRWAEALPSDVVCKKFTAAYNSFGVLSQAKRADQMAQAYKIQGVPALAVAGRYLVAGKDLKGYGDLLALTDQVIAKARGEQQKK